MINRQWLLRRRPSGAAVRDDFEYRETALGDPPLLAGQILLRNEVLLCAPTMRNWMDPPGNSLYPSIPLGEPVLAPSAGTVIASAHPDFAPGARVTTLGSWQDYEVIDGAARAIRAIPATVSTIDAMGRFGLNPLTGYFGMLRVGQPVAGATVVVSGAAGSTGSTAAQVARIVGCRVIGIAGGRDKCDWLVNACAIDAAIDYKSEHVEQRLAELCPAGIDVFYDNVGGDILQAAVENMARHGRIVLCGQIAGYNDSRPPEGPRNMMRLIYGSIRMQGFLMGDYAAEVPDALRQLEAWAKAGLIEYREDVRRGFDQIPSTFGALFDGSNRGTLLASIAE